MRKVLFSALILLLPLAVRAQTAALTGYCNQGGTQAQLSGMGSTNYQQGIIPSCKVTVYVDGWQSPTSAFYTSGGSVAGNAGQTCNVTFAGGSPSAAGTVTLTGTNTIAPKTPIVISSWGNYSIPPTSATLSSGTATCSGTAILTSVLGSSMTTIYANGSGTPLSNPFTGNAVGSAAPGQWIFWAAVNQGYDVVGNGGIPPNTYSQPTPLCTDCFPATNVVATGVQQVIAGTNINISPPSGTGIVTINSSAATTAGTPATVTLSAAQGSTDTTASVTYAAGSPQVPGYFLAGSDWESYTGATSLGSGSYTLTGITHGEFNTTPASHASGDPLDVMIVPLANPTAELQAAVLGDGATAFMVLGCPSWTSEDLPSEALTVGCPGSNFEALANGITQFVGPSNYFVNGMQVGTDVGYGDAATLDSTYPLTSSFDVLQNNQPNAVTGQISFPNGIPGGVKSTQALAAPAPILVNVLLPPGASTYTGYCGGTDELGGNIPGTSASLTDIPASGWITPNQHVNWACVVPGAVSTYVCRTAGGPNTGLLTTVSGPTIASFADNYQTATGSCPSTTNTTIPHVCVGGLAYCQTEGSSSTPNFTCPAQNGVSTAGWLYVNVAATVSPFAYKCNGTTFVTAY